MKMSVIECMFTITGLRTNYTDIKRYSILQKVRNNRVRYKQYEYTLKV